MSFGIGFCGEMQGQKITGFPHAFYNDNDGIMFGVGCNVIKKQDRLLVLPSYGLRSKSLIGTALFKLNLANVHGRRLLMDGEIKSYTFNRNEKFDYKNRYIKFNPAIKYSINDLNTDCKVKYVLFSPNYIIEDDPKFANGIFTGKEKYYLFIPKITYFTWKRDSLKTSSYRIELEAQNYAQFTENNSPRQHYLKSTIIYNYNYKYFKKAKISLRFFGSAFFINSQRKSLSFQNIFTRGSIPLIYQGFNDYTYDETFFSRQNQTRTFDQQTSINRGGGFKTPLGSAYSLGMSNNFALALNAKIDIPWKFPVQLSIYGDRGIYSVYQNTKFVYKQLFNMGLSLNCQDIIQVSIPILFNKELGDAYKSQHPTFLSRISFSLDLSKMIENGQNGTLRKKRKEKKSETMGVNDKSI